MIEDRYSVVGINEFKIGIQLKYLQEVFTLARITPIPNSPAYFQGVFNLRGNIIALIDMLKLMTGENTLKDPESNIMILNNESYSLGIQITATYSIVSISEDKMKDIDNQHELKRFCDKTFEDPALGQICLLDVKKMMNSPELTIYF